MSSAPTFPQPRWIWDVPFSPLTFDAAIEQVASLARARRPSYFITANLNYVMLNHQDPRLRDLNDRAAFVVADGITLVWASHGRERLSPSGSRVRT